MTETKIKYAATAALTVTAWDSLAAGAFAVSGQISNATNLFDDVLVGGVIALDNATFFQLGEFLRIYVVATYSDTDTDVGSALDATGAIGTTTEVLTNGKAGEFLIENADLLKVISIGAATLDAAEFLHWGPVSVAAAFGGTMPRKWALILENGSAAAPLETTGTTVDYTGVTYTHA